VASTASWKNWLKADKMHKAESHPSHWRMANWIFSSNKSPTRCKNFSSFIILAFIYSSHMFGASLCPSSGAQQLQSQPLVLPSYCGDSRAIRVLAGYNRLEHEEQNGYHHDTKVKPEAATVAVELLMMGMRTPETRCAVNKRQDNKTGEIPASSWWFIWIVWWCTDLQTLNFFSSRSLLYTKLRSYLLKKTHNSNIATKYKTLNLQVSGLCGVLEWKWCISCSITGRILNRFACTC